METLFMSRSGPSSYAKAIAEKPQTRVTSKNIETGRFVRAINVPPVGLKSRTNDLDQRKNVHSPGNHWESEPVSAWAGSGRPWSG